MRYPIFLLIISLILACDKNTNSPDGPDKPEPVLTDSTTVFGYGILERLPGIWDGAVTSGTRLGSYPEWIVDFRPISSSHVSGKAELDTVNEIFMSVFLTRYDGEYLMAFRNGGGFAGEQRVSYAKIDSVRETGNEAYYRFSDFIAGEQRVYSEFLFSGDSLHMQVFTNKYNTLSTPTKHMEWHAKRMDETAAEDAIQDLSYPKKELAYGLDSAFDDLTEAVYYSLANDPFPQSAHPYLGETSVTVSLDPSVNTTANGISLLIISTQPLFNGVIYQQDNLRYRSRYVLLRGNEPHSYTFDYMHPGTYYLNAFYDADGDLFPDSGEYLAFPFDQPFSLGVEGSVNESTVINYQIP